MLKKCKTKGHKVNMLMIMILLYMHSVGVKESLAQTVEDSLLVDQLTEVLREQFRSLQLDSARATVDKIKAIAKDADMPVKLADCNANYGLIERVRGNIDSSITYYRKAATQYKDLGERSSAARAYTAIGQTYVSMQLYQPAFENFAKSLALRESEKDSLGMANNLVNMGGAVYFAGTLDDAIDYYLRALRIADAKDNLPLKAQIMMNISNIHIKQQNHPKALEYQEEALAVHRQMGDRKGESDVLLNMGISWYEKGFLEEAETHYKESLAIKNEIGNETPGIIKLTHNLGLVAKERGDIPAAINYYNHSLALTRETDDIQTRATILNSLGVIMMVEGDDECLALLEESLEISSSLGLKKLETINYDNLHQFHANKGNYKQAYEYLSRFQALNDSLFNVEAAARIAELQTIYDTEIREQENMLLKERSQVLRLRLVMMSVSAFTITMVAVAFIILFNLKRKSLRQSKVLLTTQAELSLMEKQKSQQEQQHLKEVLFAEEEINRLQNRQIQEQNRKLSTSALLIINKNEALNNVRQIAQTALHADDCQGKICIEQLINEIDSNINLDEQWVLFKQHFESVHSGFFSRLNQKFSNLTHNDLKMCAYLRMNLSSKEIAQMLNIGINSAITKRYRLRKKFNMQNDDNLIDFLMQF